MFSLSKCYLDILPSNLMFSNTWRAKNINHFTKWNFQKLKWAKKQKISFLSFLIKMSINVLVFNKLYSILSWKRQSRIEQTKNLRDFEYDIFLRAFSEMTSEQILFFNFNYFIFQEQKYFIVSFSIYQTTKQKGISFCSFKTLKYFMWYLILF